MTKLWKSICTSSRLRNCTSSYQRQYCPVAYWLKDENCPVSESATKKQLSPRPSHLKENRPTFLSDINHYQLQSLSPTGKGKFVHWPAHFNSGVTTQRSVAKIKSAYHWAKWCYGKSTPIRQVTLTIKRQRN